MRRLNENERAQLAAFVDILLDRGVRFGLIGPREAERIWDRHILNSLAVADLIPEGSTMVDVGSGAGLPGIPLAIARPDLSVTLLESMLRRTTFLDTVVPELGLSERVRVVRARAEDHREPYDVVVARAVAPLDRLVRWCRPMMGRDAVLLALKGQAAETELANARATLAAERLEAVVLEVRAEPGSEKTRVIRVR